MIAGSEWFLGSGSKPECWKYNNDIAEILLRRAENESAEQQICWTTNATIRLEQFPSLYSLL